MEAELPRKQHKEKYNPKVLLLLLSPLLLSVFRVEPGFLVSLIALFQAIVLRGVALKGRRKVYQVEAKYLWVFPLSAGVVFLLRDAPWYYVVGVGLSYLVSLLLPRKDRLPLYVLLQSIAFQAFLPKDVKSSFYTILIPTVYGVMMMAGGLGLLERRKK